MDHIQEEKEIIRDFVKMSRYAGMREDLVQAGGGNSAVKLSDDRMLIKASGFQMADISEKSGYAVVDHSVIRDFFLNHGEENLSEEDEQNLLKRALVEGERPSIETFLHSISGRYSLHTHPVTVNAFACRENWIDGLKDSFPEAMYVPYAKPGISLAQVFFRDAKAYLERTGDYPDIIFLKNHGLLVSAETADEAIMKTEQTVRRLEDILGYPQEGYHGVTELWKLFPDKIVWMVTDHHVLDAWHALGDVWNTAFCPDCIVFLGKKALRITDVMDVEKHEDYMEAYGTPVLITYKENLYLLCDSVRKAMETQSVLSFSAQVAMLNRGKVCEYLSDDEQNALLNWESERYRKKL